MSSSNTMIPATSVSGSHAHFPQALHEVKRDCDTDRYLDSSLCWQSRSPDSELPRPLVLVTFAAQEHWKNADTSSESHRMDRYKALCKLAAYYEAYANACDDVLGLPDSFAKINKWTAKKSIAKLIEARQEKSFEHQRTSNQIQAEASRDPSDRKIRMRLASLLPTFTSRSQYNPLPPSDESTIPLTSLDPDSSYEHPSPSHTPPKQTNSSSSSSFRSSFPLRKLLLLAIIIVATYKLSLYVLYTTTAANVRDSVQSKLEAYKERYNSWRGYGDKSGGAWEFVPVHGRVDVLGRKYKSVEEGKYQSWKGLPYGQPPTEERRFRTALPLVEKEEPERVMNEWDIGCVRPRPRDDRQDGPKEQFDGHEDCLKLNVFSPLQRVNTSLLPVMVWIHGGGFVGGSSNEEKYDPKDLMNLSIDQLEQPFVFVSINYRLGAFGFTASPPPPAPEPTPPHIPTGPALDLDLNAGLKDQILALKWVQSHISKFGGDSEKVTLVGHSAGAMSVGLHMLYTGTREGNEGLFRGAFMLSGAPTSFPVPWPHDASARTLHPLPGPSQCPSPVQRLRGPPDNTLLLDCLRSLPLPKLYEATRLLTDDTPVNAWFPYYPVLEGAWGTGPTGVDGKRGGGGWLDVRPSERITRGDYMRIPVVLGSVVDEGSRFVSKDIREGEQEFLDVVRDVFEFTYGAIEDLLEPILSYYPATTPSLSSRYKGLTTNYERLSLFLGDILFQAPRRHFLRETPKDFGEPSWAYVYEEPKRGAEERLGVQHGADLEDWFGHGIREGEEEADEEEGGMAKLSKDMASYLINFVTRLDPNGPNLPRWPQYTMDRLTLQLSRGNVTVKGDDDRLEAMRFLNINNPIFAR
ncbi:hypothetical protein JCM16303_005004 [Sporobolomyces ruberrimus]